MESLLRFPVGDDLSRTDASRTRPAKRRTLDAYVFDALWAAWEAFATTTASYRGCIETAIRYGHDTDTTAAIAGGLAGIRYGVEGIPPAWLAGAARQGHRGADHR